MTAGGITVRLFLPDEWALFRAVRLRALQSDPLVFSSTYDKNAVYTDAEWQARLSDPDTGVFGVFDGADVIGMTGVVAHYDEAKFWGSWLAPEYRRRGLSDLLYRARIEWARAHPEVTSIVLSHRAGNDASRRANQRHGFIYTHSLDRVWTDGMTAPDVFYRLDL